ncbi:hypothetical protein LEN26_011146 [Aphanomyces euteiches]|nr:hypothetical protein AeMF1_016285 [Aphanomyces euteiches]KAH9120346.1 hypothetical protein LEN26_011146 [Aphanomyces euteiches]KAH9187018.1 hypothetical protein AeNC1_011003 [Aphanomyces euteiches]
MGQGASLVRTIVSDVREIVAATNKDAYLKQYNAYKEASARLEAAKMRNAALQQQLEMTKLDVYSQSEALRQQKEQMDHQIDEFANMYAIDGEFFDKHRRHAKKVKEQVAKVGHDDTHDSKGESAAAQPKKDGGATSGH